MLCSMDEKKSFESNRKKIEKKKMLIEDAAQKLSAPFVSISISHIHANILMQNFLQKKSTICF